MPKNHQTTVNQLDNGSYLNHSALLGWSTWLFTVQAVSHEGEDSDHHRPQHAHVQNNINTTCLPLSSTQGGGLKTYSYEWIYSSQPQSFTVTLWHVSLDNNPRGSEVRKPWKCKHCFLNVCASVEMKPDPQPFICVRCHAPGTEFLGEGAVAVLLSSLWCQRHVKTTPSSCDCGGCRSSAIPDGNWWPPAVPTVAMTLFCFMFHWQEAAYSPGHIGFRAGWVNGLSLTFKTWWWITGSW